MARGFTKVNSLPGGIDRTKGDERDIYIFPFRKGVKGKEAIERINNHANGTMVIIWYENRGACVVFDTEKDLRETIIRVKNSPEYDVIDKDYIDHCRNMYGRTHWDY